jgi:hypothetical protein
MEQSQLLAHCGSSKITREELKVIPTPAGSATHQPLPHFEIVGALVETLSFRKISVVREKYAVSGDGMKRFGVLDLETTLDGCRFSVGVRNSNDKSMRLALTAGYRVLVCDNMAFHGDFTPVLAKHTKNLSLVDVLPNRDRPDSPEFRTDERSRSTLGKQRGYRAKPRNWSYLDYGPREAPAGMSREGFSRQEFAAHCSLECPETAITLTTQAELYSVGDSWDAQVSQGAWATSPSG